MQNLSPKVSVIIPSYNYVQYVSQAIESVINQDYKNFEVIVVDDGSTDGSWDKIQTYLPAITAIRLANCGAARACLAGAAEATGEYFHFLDADDILMSGALARIAECCKPGVSKVQFSLQPVNGRAEKIGDPFPILDCNLTKSQLIESINNTGYYSTPPTSGNVFRRDVIELIDKIDYEKWIDGISYLLAPFVGEVATIPEPLVLYRVHGQNASAFNKLSASRFEDEENRFVRRLEHLSILSKSHHLEGYSITNFEDFSYVYERRLLAEVARGDRATLDSVRNFLRTTWRESQSWRSTILKTGWAAAIAIAPLFMAQKLTRLRVDPWSRGNSLRALKRFAAMTSVVRSLPKRQPNL